MARIVRVPGTLEEAVGIEFFAIMEHEVVVKDRSHSFARGFESR